MYYIQNGEKVNGTTEGFTKSERQFGLFILMAAACAVVYLNMKKEGKKFGYRFF